MANLESASPLKISAPTSKITKEEVMIAIKPIPEIGLEEEPTSPAI